MELNEETSSDSDESSIPEAIPDPVIIDLRHVETEEEVRNVFRTHFGPGNLEKSISADQLLQRPKHIVLQLFVYSDREEESRGIRRGQPSVLHMVQHYIRVKGYIAKKYRKELLPGSEVIYNYTIICEDKHEVDKKRLKEIIHFRTSPHALHMRQVTGRWPS